MYHSETTPIVTFGLSVRHSFHNAFKSLCISMLSWLVVSPAEKTSSDIWWIGKVVVPLHSQLKRTGFRKCLSLMSGEQVLLVSVTLALLLYNRCKTHERGARKKNFSENLVVSKSCRIFAFATSKKGWSEVSDTWLEFGDDDS